MCICGGVKRKNLNTVLKFHPHHLKCCYCWGCLAELDPSEQRRRERGGVTASVSVSASSTWTTRSSRRRASSAEGQTTWSTECLWSAPQEPQHYRRRKCINEPVSRPLRQNHTFSPLHRTHTFTETSSKSLYVVQYSKHKRMKESWKACHTIKHWN